VLRGIYQRAFVERIQAIASRLDTLIGEFRTLRQESAQVRFEVQALAQEIRALADEVAQVRDRQTSLERHVETVIASGWDTTALARRLVTLEDRLESG
jgi:uncharacterized coiled-coil DUF342 family protein